MGVIRKECRGGSSRGSLWAGESRIPQVHLQTDGPCKGKPNLHGVCAGEGLCRQGWGVLCICHTSAVSPGSRNPCTRDLPWASSELPASLTRGEHRGSRHHYIWAPSPLLIATGGSIPLYCLEGVPAFPGASQDGDEMVGWHHRLNGHGFEQALGGGEGQGAQGVSGPSSSCVWNPRVFADDARGWQCPFVLCLHPQATASQGKSPVPP